LEGHQGRSIGDVRRSTTAEAACLECVNAVPRTLELVSEHEHHADRSTTFSRARPLRVLHASASSNRRARKPIWGAPDARLQKVRRNLGLVVSSRARRCRRQGGVRRRVEHDRKRVAAGVPGRKPGTRRLSNSAKSRCNRRPRCNRLPRAACMPALDAAGRHEVQSSHRSKSIRQGVRP